MATDKREDYDVKEQLNYKEDSDADIMETILSHVGDMGLYQKLLFVTMMPFGVIFAFIYFVQMFIAVTPQNHWCKVPELANLTMELRRNLSAPISASGERERCMTFDVNWTQVLQTLTPPPAGTPMVPCQHGWEFAFDDIPYPTVVTEREWVCGAASNVPTAQSIFFVGSLFGGALLGWMADKYGRVPAFVAANLLGGVGGIATIFTSGVWDFIICRFIVGMAYDNCFIMLYILALEYVGPKHRTWVAALSIAIFFGGGCMALPWLALWSGDWRKLLWYTSLPSFIVLLAPWVLPESARWLVSRGKVNEAVKVLRKFEAVNRTQIPDDIMDEFIVSSNTHKTKNESLLALFKSPLLLKAAIWMVLVYMGCAIVFDALVRLSDSFGLDFFITFTLTSATEVPSVALLAIFLDRWGRRTLSWLPLSTSTILILVAMFAPKGIPQASLAIAARFFMNMGYSAVMQWGTEILPTGFRASGSSVLHMSGYIATMLSPFVVYSELIWSKLPFAIMTVVIGLSAGLALLLPETNGQPMPQTVADGEKIIREQSLCGKPEDDIEGPYKKSRIV